MGAAFRILFDVLAYRLRRLEMANMVAAVAIMVALRLSPADIAVRTGFALLLNLLAYLTNDYYDVERDLIGKREPATFLAAHLRAALGAQIGLVVVLLGVALLWSTGLVVALAAGGGLCWIYSARLKQTPYLDVLAMAAWGVAMPLVAVPLGSAVGWSLLGELGLFSASFELIQVARDRDEDAAAGIVTTAVRIGAARCLTAARVMMLVAAVYATLVLHRYLGLAVLGAALLAPGADVARYWNRVRFALGLVWLATLAWVFIEGGTAGLLIQV